MDRVPVAISHAAEIRRLGLEREAELAKHPSVPPSNQSATCTAVTCGDRITSAAMTTSFRILSGCDSGSPGRLRLGPGQWRGPNQVNHDPTKLSPSVHL
ncbi:unnamed protein product [Gadus morhua 'NCC']